MWGRFFRQWIRSLQQSGPPAPPLRVRILLALDRMQQVAGAREIARAVDARRSFGGLPRQSYSGVHLVHLVLGDLEREGLVSRLTVTHPTPRVIYRLTQSGRREARKLRGDAGPESLVVHETDRYRLGVENGERFIQCIRCGMRSFNATDIAQRYCGKCHAFHEDDGTPAA